MTSPVVEGGRAQGEINKTGQGECNNIAGWSPLRTSTHSSSSSSGRNRQKEKEKESEEGGEEEKQQRREKSMSKEHQE
jgi:hypothetical protein